MNLDELRSVQSTERKKDSLQNLRPSFYQEVGEYIADLEDERDRVAAQADDPFSSPDVSRLTDEIETAKDVVEAIYERRMGKIVKQASLAAAGMPADDEGLTAEEQDLFEDLVDRIESNKGRVLDVLEGEVTDSTATTDSSTETDPGVATDALADAGADPRATADGRHGAEPPDAGPPEASDPEPPTPPEPDSESTAANADERDSSGLSPADAMGGGSNDAEVPGTDSDSPVGESPEPAGPPHGDREPRSPEDDGPDAAPSPPTPDSESNDLAPSVDGRSDAPDTGRPGDEDVDRVTVRITRDVGSILGVDNREYILSSDDVVTLPEQNAGPLLERDAAEPLE